MNTDKNQQAPSTNTEPVTGIVVYSSLSANLSVNEAISASQTDKEVWGEALQRWLEAVERRRGSVRSRNEYRKSLQSFFDFLPADTSPAQVTGADCQRWAASMQSFGLSKSTINSRLGAVSSFYNFCCKKFEAEPGRYLHNFNPATSVQRLHINPYEKAHGLSVEQARMLLETCDRTTVKGARDFALLAFYVYTGRRRVEVARLRWEDIRDNAGDYEYRYRGKGGKGGWRELPAPVWTAINGYLIRSSRLESMQYDTPIFTSSKPSVTSEPIGERTVNQIVDTAAKRAGLGHIKVHALRHTAAKLRRKAGATLEETSKFLDHASIATTQIYLGTVEAKKDTSWKQVNDLLGF